MKAIALIVRSSFFPVIVVLMLTLGVVVLADDPKPTAAKSEPTAAAPAPNALKLPADDQKQLDLINERLSQMKPQVDAAIKQQADAQSRLNEANSFISQYNQVEAARMAFFFRIAADVCGCKSTDLEFAADGKSVVRKTAASTTAAVTKPLETPKEKAKP